MIKVYELTRYDGMAVRINYLGVNVNVEFKGGDYRHRATYTTANVFVQDAIEHDRRYGKLFVMVKKYEDSKKAEIREAVKAANPKRVTKIKNVNQALLYFTDLGANVTGESDLNDLMEQYNVEFPNLRR